MIIRCRRYTVHRILVSYFFFFSSRRRHTRSDRDWSSDVCSSDLLFRWPISGPSEETKVGHGSTGLIKKNQARNRKLARFGVLFAILGLLLFAYFVRKAGVPEIISGIKRLGVGFLLVIGISGIRQVARCLA